MTLTTELENYLQIYGVKEKYYAPNNFNEFVANYIGSDGRFIQLKGIKTKMHLWTPVYATHEILDENALRRMLEINYRVFFVIRNPLDIIVSNAFKVIPSIFNSVLAFNTNLAYKLKINDSIEREEWGIARLYDFDWFEQIAKDLYDYLNHYLNLSGELDWIKYENILSEPGEVLNNICQNMGLKYPENSEEITDIVGRPLDNSTHYFNPSIGKWTGYFSNRHIQVLESLGYKKLLKILGYPTDLIVSKIWIHHSC